MASFYSLVKHLQERLESFQVLLSCVAPLFTHKQYIRLERLAGTNTLAYYRHSSITSVQFYIIGPWANVLKLYFP
jgi:hypothetical protein